MRSAICLSISLCVYLCVCAHRKKRRIVNIYKRLNNFGLANVLRLTSLARKPPWRGNSSANNYYKH